MGQEIERKFLVRPDGWRQAADRGLLIRQGYLSTDPDRSVRVRRIGSDATLTIKGRTVGITRAEFEYRIPPDDAEELLDHFCTGALIEKRRHRVLHAGFTWEVDVFEGENAGLVVAEIELPSARRVVPLPSWIVREVSDDPRYFNTNLSRHPYRLWASDA